MNNDKTSIPIINTTRTDHVELFKSNGNMKEYPIILKIFNVNSAKLLEEFNVLRPTIESSQYLKTSSLANRKLAVQYPLEIISNIGSYTQEVFKLFKRKVIYPKYTIIQSGWNLGAHIDFPSSKLHGFRIHIPLQTDFGAKHWMLIDDQWEEYYLAENTVWFINVCIPHKAQYISNSERIYLSLDLWTDENIPLGDHIHHVFSSDNAEYCIQCGKLM